MWRKKIKPFVSASYGHTNNSIAYSMSSAVMTAVCHNLFGKNDAIRNMQR